VIAFLVVDGIVPSISTSKTNNIQSVVAGGNANANNPTVDTDVIISAIVAGLQANGFAPILNASNYQQIIKYSLYIQRMLKFDSSIKRMLEFNSDIKNSSNSALKI
jgi:hypothetical protein